MNGQDLSNFSMFDLFRMEVETQTAILSDGLLALETNANVVENLAALMRAAHSVKGAARIVQVNAAVEIAYVMEDCFVAAQQGKVTLGSPEIDALLRGVDQLLAITQIPPIDLEQGLFPADTPAVMTAIAQILHPSLTNPTNLTNPTSSNTSIDHPLTPLKLPNPEVFPEVFPEIIPEPLLEITPEVLPKITLEITPNYAPEANSTNSEVTPDFASSSRSSDSSPDNPPINPSINSPINPPINSPIAIPPINPQSDLLKKNQDSAIAPNSSLDRMIRVRADNLNRLMGLAGETLVETNWLRPFADSLLQLKKQQTELASLLDKLQTSLGGKNLEPNQLAQIKAARDQAGACQEFLLDRLSEVELYARRSGNLADRLYREVVTSHMAPLGDGVQGFPRMMRDIARQLGKQVRFEILGKATEVDRDILERLEAPLTHLLRNAIDHGLETPAERIAVGKSPEGTIRIEAGHRAGMLSLTISDDGRGVDLEELRQKVISRQLATPQMAVQLSEAEILEFLFLPGFSTAKTVTEISGRGVGLDIAQSMVQQVGGTLRAVSYPGLGMSFHLQLPLTLSVMRTLLVEIAGEPYAFPLTRIDRVVQLTRAEIHVMENRQYFTDRSATSAGAATNASKNSSKNSAMNLTKNLTKNSVSHLAIKTERHIGLISAAQVLTLPSVINDTDLISVIVVSETGAYGNAYGLVVDRFLGERELVVRPLDPRLGKVRDISAAALMDDGTPVLIVDVEDLVRSITTLLTSGQLDQVSDRQVQTLTQTTRKILVVDDSITVREMERKILENKGYKVEVAVNGIDGWNAVRTGVYDLIVTDIDMPRMNGIELVNQIKGNPNLKSLPVIIVSYKDREEDRLRGMEAGANYYLTKSSFHDNTLLHAVIDLIGEP